MRAAAPPILMATLSAALALSGAGARAQGQIDSFGADALQVLAGGTVSFGVGWSVAGSQQTSGGSDLTEPQPVEGFQTWLQNWFRIESETPVAVTLQAGIASTSETLSGPEGAGQSGHWGFAGVFDQAGAFVVQVGGGYTISRHVREESQLATRSCYNTGDPSTGQVYLQCDAWSLSYPFLDETTSWDGSFQPVTLQIEVLAQPVPEPGSAALGIAGLAGLATVARLRRRQGAGVARR